MTYGKTVMVHWKMETCVSLDPHDICKEIFDDRQHLCVLHKGKNENPHWHFQGECIDVKALDKRLKDWAEGHSKKIAAPKSRPVKRAKKDITYEGYQYMMKEKEPKVVSTTFTQEELDEFHEKSDDHNEQLKNQLFFYLMEKLEFHSETTTDEGKYESQMNIWKEKMLSRKKRGLPPPPMPERTTVGGEALKPKTVHARARILSMDFYMELDKLPPPNLQKLMLWHILKIAAQKVPTSLVVYKAYVGQRI